MNEQTDSQLLRAYAREHSEPAFAELVRRHVDFVYSAALRMVCDTHLAKDVTQGVFLACAKNAATLGQYRLLGGWLHRTTQNIAAQTVRTDVRRRQREQEAAAMNEVFASPTEASWHQLAPHLDAALGDLPDTDREALLLRYFERKSAREMAALLGVSPEAAQKRVNRAVDHLREMFARRGIAVGSGTLAAVLAADAVQSAPAGLATSICGATAASGIALATNLTKTLTMSTLQKTFVATALAAAIGTAVYEAHRASTLQSRFDARELGLAERARKSGAERDAAQIELAGLQSENSRLNRNNAELLKLRGEMTQLRKRRTEQAAIAPQPLPEQPPTTNAPSAQTFSSTNNLTIGWGQTAITGGWQTPSGLRAYVFATPEQEATTATLAVRLKIAEVSIPFETGASSNLISGVLSPDQYAAMLHDVQNGAINVQDSKVIVSNGQQAIIHSGSGETDSSDIALTPVISSDGQMVQMQIIPTLTYPTDTK